MLAEIPYGVRPVLVGLGNGRLPGRPFLFARNALDAVTKRLCPSWGGPGPVA
jgi:hypothetical protein